MAVNTKTGKIFEEKINQRIENVLKSRKIVNESNTLLKNDKIIGNLYGGYKFYDLLTGIGIDPYKIVKSKIIADEIVYNVKNNTFYIIEMRHMHGEGSTYKKFGNWEFEIKQFNKMLRVIDNFYGFKKQPKVQYLYILNNYQKKEIFDDILSFVKKRGCEVFFEDEIENVLDFMEIK